MCQETLTQQISWGLSALVLVICVYYSIGTTILEVWHELDWDTKGTMSPDLEEPTQGAHRAGLATPSTRASAAR